MVPLQLLSHAASACPGSRHDDTVAQSQRLCQKHGEPNLCRVPRAVCTASELIEVAGTPPKHPLPPFLLPSSPLPPHFPFFVPLTSFPLLPLPASFFQGGLFASDSPYFLWLVPTLAHSIIVNQINQLYSKVAEKCTDLENHRLLVVPLCI